MVIVDFIFLLVLFVVQPIQSARSYRRYVARLEAGELANRIKLYNQTLLMEWVGVAVLALTWWFYGRSLVSLGFVTQIDQGFWWSLLAVVLVCLYMVYTIWHAGKMRDSDRQEQQAKFGDLGHFLPQNTEEYRRFVWLSLTAGFCEELVYRAYVFWCLSHFMPMWAVVLVSSVGFGLGHTYQGGSGVVRVTIIGIVLGLLYVASGSIWLPIIAHALVDILQGAMILRFYDDRQNPEATTA